MSDHTLPPETHVGRVALDAGDVDTLVDFYTSVIGLEVHSRSRERVALGSAGGTPVLEVHASDAQPRPASAAGLFHHAIRVPDRAALGGVLQRIETDWELDGASDHGVSEALYLQDPEGNGVEVYRDRQREAWPRDDDGGVAMYTRHLDLEALRADGATRGTLSEATVGHVHLEVTDIPGSRAFYAEALGLEVTDTWAQRGALEALFLSAGGYHHHVGLNTWGGRTDPAEGRGLSWFELVVPHEDAIEALRNRVDDGGYRVSQIESGISIEDPDGIEIRIVPAASET